MDETETETAVAGDERTDARGRAGEDDVAGQQRHDRR